MTGGAIEFKETGLRSKQGDLDIRTPRLALWSHEHYGLSTISICDFVAIRPDSDEPVHRRIFRNRFCCVHNLGVFAKAMNRNTEELILVLVIIWGLALGAVAFVQNIVFLIQEIISASVLSVIIWKVNAVLVRQ